MKNMEELLEYQKQHYTDIINELNTKLMLIKEKNQATFATFSQIMSNAMNLQIKCDCIHMVYETCSQTFIKVSNFEKICKQTDTNLDIILENCESDLSSNKENWKLLLFEWNDFQVQSNEISNSISKNIKKYIKMNTSLDELIRQNANKLQHLNRDFKTIYQSKQKIKEIMISTEDILEKLKCTLTTIEKTRDTYVTQINEQDTYERTLLTSIRDLEKKIEELRRKKIIIEPYEADNDDRINNYVHEFDLGSNKELKLISLLAEEKIKKIIELEFESRRLIQLRDTRVHRLKREGREKVESQINIMNSELNNKQKLLDSVNKLTENTIVKISRFKKLFVEVVCVNNGLEDCTKVMLNFSQNLMIGNHGKIIDKLIQEELSATNVDYVEQLENLRKDSNQMEALLEERIQLLQERMKTITAQREQIELANRGLEEELNKLSKNFVKIENNVKVTDETEEEKTN